MSGFNNQGVFGGGGNGFSQPPYNPNMGTSMGPASGTTFGPAGGTSMGPAGGTSMGPAGGTSMGPAGGTSMGPAWGTNMGNWNGDPRYFDPERLVDMRGSVTYGEMYPNTGMPPFPSFPSGNMGFPQEPSFGSGNPYFPGGGSNMQ